MAAKLRSNVRINEACERYLERLKNSGQSEKSRYTAYYALRRFRLSVGNPRGPDPWVHQITADIMDAYCYGPKGIRSGGAGGEPIAAVSFNRYRSVLTAFFTYAVQMRWTDVNPMDGIDRARPDAPKQRLMLNAGELLMLLEHCDIRSSKDGTILRGNPVERIACSLGMNTGLRANDIRHLTIFDANLASGHIQTEIRKVNKMDAKPITMELHWEISKWFNTYAELMQLDGTEQLENDWLLVPSYHAFPSRDGKLHFRPKPKQVHQAPWRMVQRPLTKMGYPSKGEGFHTLRRSSARALFESLRGADYGRDHALMVVKEFLNHASTSQTEHYLGLNQERAIRDVLLKDQPFLSKLVAEEQRRVEGLG